MNHQTVVSNFYTHWPQVLWFFTKTNPLFTARFLTTLFGLLLDLHIRSKAVGMLGMLNDGRFVCRPPDPPFNVIRGSRLLHTTISNFFFIEKINGHSSIIYLNELISRFKLI